MTREQAVRLVLAIAATVDEPKALQREVIRQRVFGAVARYRPRARR